MREMKSHLQEKVSLIVVIVITIFLFVPEWNNHKRFHAVSFG